MRRLTGHRAALLYALLVLVCYGQVVWWFVFLIERGRETERLRLELAATATPDTAAEAAIRATTRRHVRMFAAEGTFFLAVITAGFGALQHAHRRERRLRQRQDELIKAVSHEFNTPLQSLRLSLETMSARDVGPERRDRYVRRMTEDVDRLADMVDELLEVQRLESAAPAPLERCSLADVVTVALARLEPRLQAAGLKVTVDARAPAEVNGRPSDLVQVVAQLLDNAVKYAAEGGEVTLAYGPGDGKKVFLSVSDRGPGLTRDDLRALFERFERGSAARRGTVPGTGLGLSIVRRIAREHGGCIAAHSDGPKTGARFEIVLPAAAPRGAGGRPA